MKGCSVWACLWIAISVGNAGFVLPDQERSWGDREKICTHYREDLTFSVGWSLTGLAWLVTPFVTGFYASGWRLSKPPYCAAGPK
jgi:hypothetical protein